MAVGGNVLSPLAAENRIIHLSSRLVVGLRLHGTVAAMHPRSAGQIKCRPFLRYFAETLKQIRCDVTVFVPPASSATRQLGWLSEHDFPCACRVVVDPTSGLLSDREGTQGRTSSSRAARANFQDFLCDVAVEQQTSPGRVLFVDSEINYRFSPAQTLVVEAFQPRRARQQRRPGPDGEGGSAASVREAALAVSRDDYTLVALAGMLVELATADVKVADYLRLEPLVEKLTVPFHGGVNYLPVENCEDMEQWDWAAVKVREAKAGERAVAELVPETQEREEHRGLFK